MNSKESVSLEKEKSKLGITVKKSEDFSEWYTQVVHKAELADYASGKGVIVIRPYAYEIWENLRNFFDAEIRKTGHKNAYFPTLIPESLLKKEAEHFEGFTPEVFWVTHAGTSELSEKLAVRPTSETIIHDSMSKWIRSWRDLPMLLNVWNSVLRAEIKSTKPFLRTTEFLWQEGHTAHASEAEAENEVMDILLLYKRVMEELFAIPVLIGTKSEKEKFVGAVYTTTLEAMMPDGKAVQMGTSHQLGQNFSKPFEIRFLGEDGEMHFVWQTSWGVSWRAIGVMAMLHGDDKGLKVPPKIAPIQVVIVPIVFSTGESKKVLEKCKLVKERLQSSGVRAYLDSRDKYTPGWKFNEWELKGVPLRIEIGPRDVANNSLVLVRRDTGAKDTMKAADVEKSVQRLLSEIQDALWDSALTQLKSQTSDAKNFSELSRILEEKGGFVRSFWCGDQKCELEIKDATGADIRVIPFEQGETKSSKNVCVRCGKAAGKVVYFGRAY